MQSFRICFYFHKTRNSPYWKVSTFVSALILVGITIGAFALVIYLLKVPGSAAAAALLFMAFSAFVSFILGFAIVPLVNKSYAQGSRYIC